MIAIVTNFKKKIESISVLEKNRNTQNPKKVQNHIWPQFNYYIVE